MKFARCGVPVEWGVSANVADDAVADGAPAGDRIRRRHCDERRFFQKGDLELEWKHVPRSWSSISKPNLT